MLTRQLPAIAGVVLATAITTAMDATGYAMFSALSLFPLFLLFWYLQGFTRADIGMTIGARVNYMLALAYPAVVLGGIALIALAAGAIDTSEANWRIALLNMGTMSTLGIIIVLLTEEGFFRGWLWAAPQRGGCSDAQTLLVSSVAFTLWHVSAITLDTGFDVPAAEVPVYLVNATLL